MAPRILEALLPLIIAYSDPVMDGAGQRHRHNCSPRRVGIKFFVVLLQYVLLKIWNDPQFLHWSIIS